MYRDTQDRMLALAERARTEPLWQEFHEYLSLHGRGIRKTALKHLDRFVASAVDWPFEDRRRFCLCLFDHLHTGEIAAPLNWKVVMPTFSEWPLQEPENAEAFMYLGLTQGEHSTENLQRALELDPGCQPARARLCQYLMADAEFNQHHLPDSYFNDPASDLLDLAEAEALCAGYEDTAWGRQCLEDIRMCRANAENWLREHPADRKGAPR